MCDNLSALIQQMGSDTVYVSKMSITSFLSGKSFWDLMKRPNLTEADAKASGDLVTTAVAHMGRSLDTTDLREALIERADDPHWDDVGERCLTCTGCTLVCPSCFCTSIDDVTDLSGERWERWRVWDSCFNAAFSYIHGGSVRASSGSRYRQWITHKLGVWPDQFGTAGCVGCGRCITWCPVGIDITAEADAVHAAGTRRAHRPRPARNPAATAVQGS